MSCLVTIDDDPMVERIIGSATGKRTRNFTSVQALANMANEIDPIAFFVDINLGAENGLAVVPTLRKRWPQCPILIVTSNTASESIREALTAGADDFICKPLQPVEVLARLQLRLEDIAHKTSKEILAIADVQLDTVRRSLRGNKGQVFISPIECTLIATLIYAKETLVEKDTLKIRCWGEFKVTDNALHRKLHAVRQALKDVSDEVIIQTKYGVGFSIEKLPESVAA
jgi:DNA-binding response OmpR family regulator